MEPSTVHVPRLGPQLAGHEIVGKNGEDKACAFLTENSYRIVERNFRTRSGEIDIIAQKDETIVFVEVKTLPKGTVELLSAVLNIQKQKRIIKTAKCFLSIHRQYSNKLIRFDVIVVDMPGLPEVYHLENAFAEIL